MTVMFLRQWFDGHPTRKYRKRRRGQSRQPKAEMCQRLKICRCLRLWKICEPVKVVQTSSQIDCQWTTRTTKTKTSITVISKTTATASNFHDEDRGDDAEDDETCALVHVIQVRQCRCLCTNAAVHVRVCVCECVRLFTIWSAFVLTPCWLVVRQTCR